MKVLAAILLVLSLSGSALADEMTVAELNVTDPGVVVLDVRTEGEFNRGHIESALNINVLADNFGQRVAGLDKDKVYVVHCAINSEAGRSDKAIDTLRSLGFDNVVSLKGGYNAWASSGRRVTLGSAD